MKILIVDDEPCLREIFSRLLTRNGHEVETAADGVEGLFRFRHGEFDAVVSDYQMSLLDGVLMLREISELAPGVRLILMSGDPPESRHLPPGTRILRKPFRQQDLLEALGA